ncbi:MAG: hypothetical protein M3467_00590 [Actinomycetota bacterium]|nr:hypothetical protein [Actinomycetota bacterium]
MATLGAMAVGSATLVPATTATAGPGDSPDCPLVKPVRRLASGDPVTARTVSKGTSTDSLTGEVVGVIDGGISPSIDMIMVKLEGSRVTDAAGDVDAGIWAGMSGSPVYAANGRLIGAVSYGLSWSPSEYAGVTPAAAMYDIMGSSGAKQAEVADEVDVPAAVERQLRADGVQSASTQQFERLPMPLSVSGGLSTKRLEQTFDKTKVDNSVQLVTGRGGAMQAAESGEMFAGGNLAASLSYGDVTFAGVGTTTAVCDGNVIGFGHPMMWSGPSQMTMHGADALYVQADKVFGSFKVANPTAPAGSITRDQLAAIGGRLGTSPATTKIVSTTTFGARSRTGKTFVSVPDWTGYIAAIHNLINGDDIYDGIRAGTSRMDWAITVDRASGKSITIDREDMVASNWDITYETPWGIYSDVGRVISNRFEDVQVSRVQSEISYDERVLSASISKVEAKQDGRWQTLSRKNRVRVPGGSELKLRITVKPGADSDAAKQRVRSSIRVPKSDQRWGELTVIGGASMWERPRGVMSFAQLVAWLERQAPGNSVSVRVDTGDGGGGGEGFKTSALGVKTTSAQAETKATVRGGKYFSLRIVN